MTTKSTPPSEISVIGIDIGKDVFHLVGFDADGKIVLRKKIRRLALVPTFEELPRCIAGMEACMLRELKRRSAIEPMIGHAKNDGRLGRNYLLGTAGDKINAILAAAGHNLRLVLNRLALLFARIPGGILYILPAMTSISAATITPAA